MRSTLSYIKLIKKHSCFFFFFLRKNTPTVFSTKSAYSDTNEDDTLFFYVCMNSAGTRNVKYAVISMNSALRYSDNFLVFSNEITRRILALHSLDKSFESKQTFATIFFSRFARIPLLNIR